MRGPCGTNKTQYKGLYRKGAPTGDVENCIIGICGAIYIEHILKSYFQNGDSIILLSKGTSQIQFVGYPKNRLCDQPSRTRFCGFGLCGTTSNGTRKIKSLLTTIFWGIHKSRKSKTSKKTRAENPGDPSNKFLNILNLGSMSFKNHEVDIE